MADQVTNYHCPACTGPLHYVGASGKLECDYCGSSYETSEIEGMMQEKEQKAQETFRKEESKMQQKKEEAALSGDSGTEWQDDNMKAYGCPSCGAELVCDETTVATSCPYCGNPTVVPGQFDGMLKPDLIIPFKLDQEAAKKALKKHYEGKRLLPSAFVSGNKINEIKGVYVPFWMFDNTADVSASFEAEKRKQYRQGDYEVTETRHYDVRRSGTVPFEKIPVDASTKMPDAHMDAIEPYDYNELKEFSSVYLPGYLAEKYDVSKDDSRDRAAERAKNSAVETMKEDVTGYDSVRIESSNVNLKKEKSYYAMLPVYMLSTKWNGESFLFAMNGQSGKLIGDLPIDNKKYWMYFGVMFAAITAILGTILVYFEAASSAATGYGIAAVLGLIIAFVFCQSLKSAMKTARAATAARNYLIRDQVTFRVRDDRYTHTTTERRKIEKPQSGGKPGPKGR